MMWDVKQILKELKKKLPYVPDELEWYFPGSFLDAAELKILNSSPTALELEADGLVSSSQLDDFAKGLNFFSPRGYDYARENLKLNLPHPKLVRETFVQTNGAPGYMQEMLDIIKMKADKSDKPPLCALSMVKQGLNRYEKADYGCEVDFGGFDCGDEEAKEVLMFLLTFLDETLHIPVGYFMVPYLSTDQMKNMAIGAMELTHDTGVKVVSLTTELNFNLIESLGCTMNSNSLKTTFDHPVTKEPVLLFGDANQCMQYIRLALQAYSPITVSDTKNTIDWSHIERSVNLLAKITETDLHSELIKAHVNLRGKIKGNIACEKLSNSLAGFGQIMAQKLSNENTRGLEPTIEYIETFNKVYDILTTRALTKPGNGEETSMKSSMTLENGAAIMQYFNSAENYMKSLKSKTGNNLMDEMHARKGFLGLLACIHSAAFLYNNTVLPGDLNILPLQKLSLDHIRQFINIIRAQNHLKPNQDPISRHYKEYFKSLLKRLNSKANDDKKLIQVKKEFMLKTDSTTDIINMTSSRTSSIVQCEKVTEAKVNKEQDKTLKLIYSAPLQVLDFTNPISTYVAGYVASYLYNAINCEVCNDALVTADTKPKRGSIRFKDDFGFVHPSKDVAKICEITESYIKKAIITLPKELREKDIFKSLIVNQTLTYISGSATNIFNKFYFHQFDQDPNENHLILLMRAVSEEYINVRSRYLPVIKTSFMAGFSRDLKKLSCFKTGQKNEKRPRLW